MHHTTKPQHIKGKVKIRSNQMHPPYNAGIQFLSVPNVPNSGQLQNAKYLNNMGNINDVSVLQYHRTNNMQIKNHSLEANHFPNIRHQQPQPFVYKNPQFHNHLNLQQNLPVNHHMQRKFFKEQQHVEFSSKKSKEFLNQQQANKLSGTNKNGMTKMFKKIPTKASNNGQEETHLNEESADANHTKNNQVPTTVQVSEGTSDDLDEVNKTQIQQEMEQVLNINNEPSESDNCEDANEKSIKDSREKTPMCLINDLARYNKISFQYRLTSENGPAHCKRFTVTLKLGDEEYTAEGFKIKKAQHLAAKEAIEKTKYKHPIPKTNRRTDVNMSKSNITPTVELNALAMKLGQQTYYIFDPQQIDNSNHRFNSPPFEENKPATQPSITTVESLISSGKQVLTLSQKRQFLSKYQNRYMPFQHSIQNSPAPAVCTYFPFTSPCKITLLVGTKQFIGVGRTLQQAKHDAATNALQVLKEQMRNEESETNNTVVETNDNKSPISMVFEMGIKRNLPVDFKVLREEGPAHMRTFITACSVGDITTEGKGNGKKISKKKAAQKMLEELKKLPPLSPVSSPIKRVKLKVAKKKSSGQSKSAELVETGNDLKNPCHKEVTTEVETNNPVNTLLEWRQNKKKKEPVLKLIGENPHRNQFVIEANSKKTMALAVSSSNKRMAKQDAAKKSLTNVVKESERDPATATENDSITKAISIEELKKTVAEATQEPLQEDTYKHLLTNKESCQEQENLDKTTADNSSATPLTTDVTEETSNISSKAKNHHMKDQLMYLAKLLGFDVEFSDYPKGNHSEFLSIVMLSTTPAQICHGVGVNLKESREDASKNALKILSEMGFNNAVNA